MSDEDRHVVPSENGGWDVRAPGAQRASAHTATQREAIARARQIMANTGGETVIHGRDGQIRAKDTSPSGNDPIRRRTSGRAHLQLTRKLDFPRC
ncbi:DUF2188 domain-containing protein [Lentzea sp. NPDC005914]|uniref:DUF2188 domain-containing protein n=1 Tax=Lentzea sp. NPDC005914 TaxID=3154572 RepID=UPI0033F492F7